MIVGIVLIVVFLVVLFFGMPISMGMGISTLAAMIAGEYDFSTLPMLIQKGANSYTLISIPYFILAANIMNRGGITNRIFDFCESLVGWMHGGLAQVNVISSVIFAGISGTSSADAAGLGMVEIEAMDRAGYDRRMVGGHYNGLLHPGAHYSAPALALLYMPASPVWTPRTWFIAGRCPGAW